MEVMHWGQVMVPIKWKLIKNCFLVVWLYGSFMICTVYWSLKNISSCRFRSLKFFCLCKLSFLSLNAHEEKEADAIGKIKVQRLTHLNKKSWRTLVESVFRLFLKMVRIPGSSCSTDAAEGLAENRLDALFRRTSGYPIRKTTCSTSLSESDVKINLALGRLSNSRVSRIGPWSNKFNWIGRIFKEMAFPTRQFHLDR